MKNFIIISESKFDKARKIIKENSNKKIIFFSMDDDLNRKILEKEKIEILLIRFSGRKDFQKQRNSGFNQVLAKIAKKNRIKIGIDLDEIINSGNREKSEVFGRVIQNIKLCNKNRIQMKFISTKYKRNLIDLKALGLVLGMPTWMTKDL